MLMITFAQGRHRQSRAAPIFPSCTVIRCPGYSEMLATNFSAASWSRQ